MLKLAGYRSFYYPAICMHMFYILTSATKSVWKRRVSIIRTDLVKISDQFLKTKFIYETFP